MYYFREFQYYNQLSTNLYLILFKSIYRRNEEVEGLLDRSVINSTLNATPNLENHARPKVGEHWIMILFIDSVSVFLNSKGKKIDFEAYFLSL